MRAISHAQSAKRTDRSTRITDCAGRHFDGLVRPAFRPSQNRFSRCRLHRRHHQRAGVNAAAFRFFSARRASGTLRRTEIHRMQRSFAFVRKRRRSPENEPPGCAARAHPFCRFHGPPSNALPLRSQRRRAGGSMLVARWGDPISKLVTDCLTASSTRPRQRPLAPHDTRRPKVEPHEHRASFAGADPPCLAGASFGDARQRTTFRRDSASVCGVAPACRSGLWRGVWRPDLARQQRGRQSDRRTDGRHAKTRRRAGRVDDWPAQCSSPALSRPGR